MDINSQAGRRSVDLIHVLVEQKPPENPTWIADVMWFTVSDRKNELREGRQKETNEEYSYDIRLTIPDLVSLLSALPADQIGKLITNLTSGPNQSQARAVIAAIDRECRQRMFPNLAAETDRSEQESEEVAE